MNQSIHFLVKIFIEFATPGLCHRAYRHRRIAWLAVGMAHANVMDGERALVIDKTK